MVTPWLCVAASYLDWCTEDSDNWSKAIQAFLKRVGHTKPVPWCAAFVAHVGYFSMWNPASGKSAWPLPLTAGCKELGAAGYKRSAMYPLPQVGDIFLLYFEKLGRFAHTGFVLRVHEDGSYDTIEGNTNKAGEREGTAVLTQRRRVEAGDQFLRVIALV